MEKGAKRERRRGRGVRWGGTIHSPYLLLSVGGEGEMHGKGGKEGEKKGEGKGGGG